MRSATRPWPRHRERDEQNFHNGEANAIVIGHDFAAKMERMFEDDLTDAREITRAAWAQRPWSERLRQRGAWLLKYWI